MSRSRTDEPRGSGRRIPRTVACTVVAGALSVGCAAEGAPATTAATPVTSPSSAQSEPSTSPSTRAGGEDDRCRLADLRAQLTTPNTPADHSGTQLRVIWTNTTQRTCTMTGFGGMDLVDAAGEHYSVPRANEAPTPASAQERTPATVRLTPGGTAHSTLVLVAAAGGQGSFRPTSVLATPPDETRSVSLPWTAEGLPRFERPSAYELHLDPVRPNVS